MYDLGSSQAIEFPLTEMDNFYEFSKLNVKKIQNRNISYLLRKIYEGFRL